MPDRFSLAPNVARSETMQDIIKTFELHTNICPTVCPECGEVLDIRDDTIDHAINHVLGHGWKLLHVGSEQGDDEYGRFFSHTVAILGRPSV
ncbi:MAG: hypothetical protein OXC14_08100 [Rhodospirillaceae bacterium]|nr:hypothetical protein [Rhodospirillaceae bacterium]